VQWIAPVYPPRANWGAAAADMREDAAENAKQMRLNRSPTGRLRTDAERAEKTGTCGFLAILPYLIGDCDKIGGVSAARSGKSAGTLEDMSDAKIDIPNL